MGRKWVVGFSARGVRAIQRRKRRTSVRRSVRKAARAAGRSQRRARGWGS
jgi:hypothetical protein